MEKAAHESEWVTIPGGISVTWMWHLGTRFSGRLDNVSLEAGPDPKDLFQPK